MEPRSNSALTRPKAALALWAQDGNIGALYHAPWPMITSPLHIRASRFLRHTVCDRVAAIAFFTITGLLRQVEQGSSLANSRSVHGG